MEVSTSDVRPLVGELLARGSLVRLTLRGWSMAPTLPPGTPVWVRGGGGDALSEDELGVYRSSGAMVLHRCVGVVRSGAESALLFRGDGTTRAADVVPSRHVLGKVVAIGSDPEACLAVDAWLWRSWSALARTVAHVARPGWRGADWRLGRALAPSLRHLLAAAARLAPSRLASSPGTAARSTVTHPPFRVRANPRAIQRAEGDGALLLDPRTGSLCRLNALGRRVFGLCREPISFEELIAGLGTELPDVPRARLRADLTAFLAGMMARGMVLADA